MSYPEIVVGGFCINNKDQKKICLVKTVKNPDEWSLPGGRIEYGERVEDALRRELDEEVSLKISNISFLGWGEYITKKRHFIFFDYLCYAIGDPAIKIPSEIIEVAWLSLNAEEIPRRIKDQIKIYKL